MYFIDTLVADRYINLQGNNILPIQYYFPMKIGMPNTNVCF